MKTAIILLTTTLIISTTAFAQGNLALNFAGSVNVGLGDFGDTYATGLGATTTILYSTSSLTDLTFSVGYNKWKNDNFSFTTIPLLAGFRYLIPLKGVTLYVPVYLGIHFTTKETELPVAEIEGETIGGGTISFSNNFFGFGIGFGLLIPVSPTLNIDLNTTFNSIATSESNSNYISGNIGVHFGL
jgi:hypothetical protein